MLKTMRKLLQMLITHKELPMTAKYVHKFHKYSDCHFIIPYDTKFHWLPNRLTPSKYFICAHD